MDDVLEISLLLDFYGQMLTKRQYEIMDLHYNSDFSLGEIAHQQSISRQGVFDNIKRGKALLFSLEEKLGLLSKFSKQRIHAQHALEALNAISLRPMEQKDLCNMDKAKKLIENMLEVL